MNDHNFCFNCGIDLRGAEADKRGPTEAVCRSCGVLVPFGSKFCTDCGVASPHGDRVTSRPAEDAPTAAYQPVKGGPVAPPLRPPPPLATRLPPLPAPVSTKSSPSSQSSRPSRPSPIAIPEGWTDITEEVAEIEFLALQGLEDEARSALHALGRRHPGHPDLGKLEGEWARSMQQVPVEESAEADELDAARSDSRYAVDIDVEEDEVAPIEDAGPAVQSMNGAALEASAPEMEIDASDRTVITPVLLPPRPYQPTAGPSAEPAPADDPGSRDEPRPVKVTLVPGGDGPASPAPFSGEPPPGSSLIPGTTPPPGGFSTGPTPIVPTTEEGTVIARNPLPPKPYGGAAPPSAVPAVPPVRIVMLGAHGETLAERVVESGESFEVGRDTGAPWGDDRFLEPHHARLTPSSAGGVTVDDNGGTTKVFRRLSSPTQLREGDEFRVGESLVIYDGTNAVPQRGDFGRIVVCPHDGRPASAHAIGPDGLLMGRQVGDVTFEADTFVSSEHCRISITGTAVVLEDLDSSNGTHIRIRTGERVPVGSLLLIGQTQFEVRAL